LPATGCAGHPFLFYFAVLNPILVMMVHVFAGQPAIPPGVSPLAFWVDSLGPGLMWFVEALLIFSFGYLLWRLATARRSQAAPPPSGSQTERGAPGNGPRGTRRGLVFALAVRLGLPVGIDEPSTSSRPVPAIHRLLVGLSPAG
jgi:hypothetical protein